MYASQFIHAEVVKVLLAQGAEVNLKNDAGMTALDVANTEAIALLHTAAGAK